MSKEKVLKMLSMSPIEKAMWHSKRNQRPYWKKFDHKDWVAYCMAMSEWFKKDAPDEWDKFVVANTARKAANDKAALLLAIEKGEKGGKKRR